MRETGGEERERSVARTGREREREGERLEWGREGRCVQVCGEEGMAGD